MANEENPGLSSLREWMLAPWSGDLPFEYDVADLRAGAATKLQVFVAFASMDGGGYGFIVGDDNPYGRRGLYQKEAYVWWEIRSFVNGWLAGTNHAEGTWLAQAVIDERERVEKLRAEHMNKGAEPAP